MNKKADKKPKNRSGYFMLAITIILYLITAVSDPQAALSALGKSGQTLKMIAPTLLIVFFLLALLNSFIKVKQVAQYLGADSGIKATIVVLAASIFSHGPGYVWFPILSELRKHGTRDGLLVTFFYARAIKLPWLPLMISYFGFVFTLILSIYIVLGAWIQGVIADKIAEKTGKI